MTFFKIKRIGEKVNYKQTGPTCWYYAAKYLVNLHELRKDSEFEQKWKKLKIFKKIFSKLRNESSDVRFRKIQKVYIEILESFARLRRRNSKKNNGKTISITINNFQNYEAVALEILKILSEFGIKKTYLMQYYPSVNKKEIFNLELLGKDIKAMFNLLTKHSSIMNPLLRIEILNNHLGDGLFSLKKLSELEITIGKVDKLLQKHGPFYASGSFVLGGRKLVKKVNRYTFYSLKHKKTKMEVPLYSAYFSGKLNSRHAITVIGCSLGREAKVFYIDPNKMDVIHTVNFDLFKKFWCGIKDRWVSPPTNINDIEFYQGNEARACYMYIDCGKYVKKHMSKDNGCCDHREEQQMKVSYNRKKPSI